MKDKILKNFTIIPQNLYVHREADRQIRRNIEEMGRPAYILVSRQMGKTNLLLNAKREIESNEIKFVYVDVSNSLPEARDRFRSIVDIALRGHNVFFGSKNQIDNIRNKKLPDTIAHEQELLALLSVYSGKLIIVLDEIDALTNTKYSDSFFAQIRSTYFAGRTNYPELQRLSYILSGVVEPSNLIKDKNKSPFNIGEKIYLDDFTYEEHLDLIKKTPNDIAETCGKRIYEYTNGQPRMTWDICSLLEDMYLKEGTININDVDIAIKKLYLDDFNHAPIDHIRNLAQSNVEIRRAIRDIHDGNCNISENVKRKLYLSGVIKSDISSHNAEIKNVIIKNAISLEWLNGIDKDMVDIISIAKEQQSLGNYKDAIKFFKQYIDSHSDETDEITDAVYYELGYCHTNIYDYSNAIEYYNKCGYLNETDTPKYFNILFDIGTCHHYLGQYTSSSSKYKLIIDKSKSSIIKTKAKLNYAASILAIDFDKAKHEASNIYKELLEDIKVINFNDINEVNELKVIAHFNLGYISSSSKNHDTAYKHYSNAISTEIPKYRPAINLKLYELTDNLETKRELTVDSINTIIDNKLRIDNYSTFNLVNFTSQVLFETLLNAYNLKERDEYNRLNDYTLDKIFGKSSTTLQLYIRLANYCMSSGNYKTCVEINYDIIRLLAKDSDGYDKKNTYLTIYRNIFISKSNLKTSSDEDWRLYLSNFIKSNDPTEDDDLSAFTLYAIRLRNLKQYNLLVKNLNIIIDKNTKNDSIDNLGLIWLYLLRAQAYEALKKKRNSFIDARTTIELTKEYNQSKSSKLSIKEIDSIKIEAERIFTKFSSKQPSLSTKIGRNDPCLCGSGRKFKKCCGQ